MSKSNKPNVKIKFLTSFAIISLITTASFATADNITTNNSYTPQGGSLSNVLSADGNSASNNGSIGTSSSAFANKLDSSISNVSRLENTNQQFGNSDARVGNISNSAAGGAGGYANSGGNTLSNGQGQSQGMGQSQNSSNANNSNSGSTGNTTTVTGGNTTVQRSAPGLGGNVSFQQVGTTGFNIGATSIFGGAQIGFNHTNKDAKALMKAQTEELFQKSNSQYVANIKETCSFVSEDDCQSLKEKLVNDLLNN